MREEEIKSIFARKTIAVVGLSKDPEKHSHRVASYLKSQGYKIIPVNPTADEILGEKCYKGLLEIPEDIQKTIEIVDIFRPSEEVQPIAEQAVELKKKHKRLRAVWMQLGISNDKAAETAKKAGIEVVMDMCMMREHRRFVVGDGQS